MAKEHSVPQNLQCLPSGPAQQVSANPWVKCMLLAKEEVGCHLSGCGCSLPTHRNYPFGTFRTLKLPCLLFFYWCIIPSWLSGTESACQCRGLSLDTWVGKIPWIRKWQSAPVFLPGTYHGQRSLVDHSTWGCKRVWKQVSD